MEPLMPTAAMLAYQNERDTTRRIREQLLSPPLPVQKDSNVVVTIKGTFGPDFHVEDWTLTVGAHVQGFGGELGYGTRGLTL